MKYAERQTRSHLMSLFQHQGIHPRTDLGQNFLIDLNLIDYVVDQAQVGPDDVVLEIGTGTGGLTAYLAQTAGDVVSVEIDHRVHALAKEVTGSAGGCRLRSPASRTLTRNRGVAMTSRSHRGCNGAQQRRLANEVRGLSGRVPTSFASIASRSRGTAELQ